MKIIKKETIEVENLKTGAIFKYGGSYFLYFYLHENHYGLSIKGNYVCVFLPDQEVKPKQGEVIIYDH